jgi:hypothetical protein
MHHVMLQAACCANYLMQAADVRVGAEQHRGDRADQDESTAHSSSEIARLTREQASLVDQLN